MRFVLARDRSGRYRFAPLGGETAQLRLEERFSGDPPDSIVLEDVKSFKIRSDAVIGILSGLRLPWRVMAAAIKAVPRPLRDAAYDLVGRRRRRWFGRREACAVPTPEQRSRFLP